MGNNPLSLAALIHLPNMPEPKLRMAIDNIEAATISIPPQWKYQPLWESNNRRKLRLTANRSQINSLHHAFPLSNQRMPQPPEDRNEHFLMKTGTYALPSQVVLFGMEDLVVRY